MNASSPPADAPIPTTRAEAGLCGVRVAMESHPFLGLPV
jgi:hypothetical protein